MSFSQLGLSAPLLRALEGLGYKEPTPIQAAAIPLVLKDRDVLGQAQTGTGKTGAFMLPILERIDAGSDVTQALVLCPTRELALQVADASREMARHLDGVNVVPVYGGAPIREQVDRLSRGAQVVVGTPGRVLDLLQRGKLLLHDARMVVLDEADEMLSMGFIDDVRAILRHTPWGRQTLLFSATIPPEIQRLADEELHSPETIRVTPDVVTVEATEQFVVYVEPRDRLTALERVLREADPRCAIIFTRTKLACQRLADDLAARGHRVRALHGDMGQGARDSVMIAFRARRIPVLVATDVAARGLDVSHVTHVINFELPDEPEVYVHRIGRTGRVGRDGCAITLVAPKEKRKFEAIVDLIGVRPAPWGKPEAPDATPEPAEPAPTSPPAASPSGEAAAAPRRRGRRGGRRRRPSTSAVPE
jgi:ATP-dependent RNA helicase DeaD